MLSCDLGGYFSFSRAILAILRHSVMLVTWVPLSRGFIPLLKIWNAFFSPFLVTNKEWFFGSFLYLAWYIIKVYLVEYI